MNISQYAVKNSQFTLIMVFMIIVVGISTILGMPRAEDPETHPPIFPVVAVYPGTSPRDMEELVVKPLEKRIFDLENIKQIKTGIHNGVAVLAVEYKYGVNVDDKYQELVREASAAHREASAARGELPADLYSLEVQKVDPTKVNILQIALVSENASRKQLKLAAEGLQDELEKVNALKDVKISGLSDQLIRIDILPEKIASLGIPLSQLMQAVQSEAANIPGGSVVFGSKSLSVKTSGNYQSVEEIRNTIVHSHEGKNTRLRDVADVYPDFAPETHITRLNQYRSVLVNAALKAGENISAAQEQYLPVIEAYKGKLPPNIALMPHFDQAENVNKRLGGLGIDFGIAILLVSITLLLVSITLLPLGLRAAAVVMVAIPLSLSIGILLVNALGYSLNQLSIVGFVVALGLLVDDSIVVVENIERWMREGYSRLEATIRGTKQITLAVIGCTATLVIAFLPIMFMPEMSGDFIRSLPVSPQPAGIGDQFHPGFNDRCADRRAFFIEQVVKTPCPSRRERGIAGLTETDSRHVRSIAGQGHQAALADPRDRPAYFCRLPDAVAGYRLQPFSFFRKAAVPCQYHYSPAIQYLLYRQHHPADRAGIERDGRSKILYEQCGEGKSAGILQR